MQHSTLQELKAAPVLHHNSGHLDFFVNNLRYVALPMQQVCKRWFWCDNTISDFFASILRSSQATKRQACSPS